MTRTCARPVGLIAAAAIAAVAGAPAASASELVVIVTPYITQPPSENQSNVQLRGFGTFSVKKKAAGSGTQNGSASDSGPTREQFRQR